MKKLIYILVMFFPVLVIGQTPTENYIKTTTYQVETTTGSVLADEKIESVTYFDGLGRPKQIVSVAAGGNKEDIITHINYDEFGRQTKDYLPYTDGSGNLDIRPGDIELETKNFYNTLKYENTLNPYLEKHFESSPLNRLLEQAAPGADWALNESVTPTDTSDDDLDHTIKFEHGTNTDADMIRLFEVDLSSGSPTLVESGVYQPNELYKTITKDENWKPNTSYSKNHTSEEYKDKQGQIVLKRTYNNNKWHDTYYVYDDYGNLTFVLPPELLTYNNIAQHAFDINGYYDEFYNEPSPFFNGSTQTVIYFEANVYSSGFHMYIEMYNNIPGPIGVPFKDGKLADSNFNLIPDITLGDIMDGNVSAATVYMQDGDIYIDSHDVVISNSDIYFSVSFDIEDFQSTFSPLAINPNDLDKLAYQYKYDERNRLIEKKIPGKGKEYIVYDKLDRPVLTQDANLLAINNPNLSDNQWLFTKYDVFGRVIYTGLYNSNLDRATLQGFFNNKSASENYEVKADPGDIGFEGIYYYNNNFPYSNLEILTINYYDDYTFDKDGMSLPINYEGQTVINHNNNNKPLTKGLATGSKVKVLNTSPTKWITTITGYDTKARPIYVASKNNYLETTDVTASKLNFTGAVDKMETYHNKQSTTVITKDLFTYDHMGRLTKQTQELNNTNALEVITENHYDELGQLQSKGVGGSNTNRLQNVDYTYNIRGWLKTINNPINLGNDLFGFGLTYNQPEVTVTGSLTPLYNGNISHTFWKTNNEDNRLKEYRYNYDALNRIINAHSSEAGISTYKYNMYIYGYDRNGNIERMVRRMPSDLNDPLKTWYSSTTMDDLTYSYDGNKLLNVKDGIGLSATGIEGFKDGNVKENTGLDDYTYDANGNMVKDLNKSIGTTTTNGITYNHLNLPDEVKFENNNNKKIKYIYDATGVKLSKAVYNNSSTATTTYYAGNYVYEGSSLKFFNHPEGYVDAENGFDYVYQYKDHLGNARLSYKADDRYLQLNYDTFDSGLADWNGVRVNENGRLKVTVQNQYTGTGKHLIEPFNVGEKVHVKLDFDKYTTTVPIRLIVNERDANNNSIGWYFVANAENGTFQSSHTIVNSNVARIYVKFDIASSIASATQFYVDNIVISRGEFEILEENNYYPFGLKHKGYNGNVGSTNIALKRKFGGKEYQDELGLGWYDITARNYDPALGRWMNLDPLAENGRRWSPYNFSFDNPVFFQDPDGMWPFPSSGLLGYLLKTVKRTLGNVKDGDNLAVAHLKSVRDDPVIENLADELPGAGEALDISKGNYGSAALGIIPFGKKIKKGVELASDALKTTKKTSKAARREAMREAGIPTSQPLIPDKATKSKDKVFLTRDKKSTVQDAKNDVSHKGEPHWEAGPTKKDVNSPDGLNRSGNNNKPQMGKPKSKAEYDE
ncbi:DUF6443 domain-containing protein [uncultured Algibacter sp.]|uniref:DUF6443 domain-containing protein n=1 Tax=uncultured Algibacter sp. TaxID=298659 RepID=UPI00262D2F62|nr:DUF6443 domain-containing protein [uncultured Algibacter sp.]